MAKALERARIIRKQIDTKPIVLEIGELNAPADQILDFLRRSGSFISFKEDATCRLSKDVRCRFEQIAPSYIGIQWLDRRWKSSRLSRATLRMFACGLNGDHTCIEFTHVGLPQNSLKETRMFWMGIFRPLLSAYGVPYTGHRAMQVLKLAR